MAVEIKELIIRAEIDYGATAEEGTTASSPTAAPEVDTDALVQTCVKQVLKILKQKQQR